MTTTPVGNGQTANGTDVTSGNTLDVQSGGTATATTIESGGTEMVESGGTDSGAMVKAGGTQTLLGSSTNDTVAGMVNINGATATLTGATVNGGGVVALNTTGAQVSNVAVNSGGALDLNIKGTTATNTTVNAGGSLLINGNAQANGVTLNGGTFELASPKADTSATGTVAFASGVASKIQIDVAQPTVTAFSPTITGFAAGDLVDEEGLTFAGSSFSTSTSGNTTTVTVTGGNNTGSQSFTFSGVPAANFAIVSDNNTAGGAAPGLEIVVCFAAGTLIRTADGEVAIERLAIGDRVVTTSGELRPIRWLGHRTVDCRAARRKRDVLPVRIAADAFGPSRPARDLWVSPGHAICVDMVGEVLIPAGALVNGATIAQVEVDTITYWHVELDSHDVILAENMPAETYLAMSNRAFFSEHGVVALDATPDVPRTHADFCRPFHERGPFVEIVARQLAARAEAAGWRREETPASALHLLVDGQRIEAAIDGGDARFLVPAGSRDVQLVSPSTSPAAVFGTPDTRRLGFLLTALRVEGADGVGRAIALDDPRLVDGFLELEFGSEGLFRWTDGAARFPVELLGARAGDVVLHISAGPMLPRWVAPAGVSAASRVAA